MLLYTLGSSPLEVGEKPDVPVAAIHTGSCLPPAVPVAAIHTGSCLPPAVTVAALLTGSCLPPAVTCPPTNTQTTEGRRQHTNMDRSQQPSMATNPGQMKDNAGKVKPSVDSGQVSSVKTKAQLKAERRAVQVTTP